jgi:ketosteroid isomerase-like protein
MEDARGWAESLFALLDRFDADAIAARMARDGALVSVNDDPVVGRDAMREAVHNFQRAVASISHEVLRAWQAGNQAGNTVIAELRVTYVRHDGRKVVLPCTNIFDLNEDGLVTRYQIYMDISPVFA